MTKFKKIEPNESFNIGYADDIKITRLSKIPKIAMNLDCFCLLVLIKYKSAEVPKNKLRIITSIFE